ncbi:MAG: RluA family pseudouridine synthase [Gemmataceae bacterium]
MFAIEVPLTPLSFLVIDAEAGHTLAKVLRSRLHESQPSWNDIRDQIGRRRVKVNDTIVVDPTRRLKLGEKVEFLAKPVPAPKGITPTDLPVRYLDDHIVVVEKAAGINTVRHPAELAWPEKHKALDPTLEDLTQWAIAARLGRKSSSLPRLRVVQRLDRETSGLLVFTRSVLAERELGMQFRKHTVVRRYLAVVPGIVTPQTFRSNLVRDRGDGRRGSTNLPKVGKPAVTHMSVEERLKGYTLVSCRLETGRTHQIRIHTSEAGHPICGDPVYCIRPDHSTFEDTSGAPRLALHATELGFVHPVTGANLHWTMPLPPDLDRFVKRLRG